MANNNEYQYSNYGNENNYGNNGPVENNRPVTRPLFTENNVAVLSSSLNVPEVPYIPDIRIPVFKKGTDPNLLSALNKSRRNSGAAALKDVKAQLESYGPEAAQKLLLRVALDDILNHMRSVEYDEDVIAILMSLSSELDSSLAAGTPLDPDIVDQVKQSIQQYYTVLPGAVYPAAREFYLNKMINNLKRNRAATRIASGYRGYKGRKTAKGQRKIRNLMAAQKAAKAAAEVAAEKNKANKNAARKAAFEKRFGLGPASKRKTRRRRN